MLGSQYFFFSRGRICSRKGMCDELVYFWKLCVCKQCNSRVWSCVSSYINTFVCWVLVRDALALAVGLIMTSVHVNFQLQCALVRQRAISLQIWNETCGCDEVSEVNVFSVGCLKDATNVFKWSYFFSPKISFCLSLAGANVSFYCSKGLPFFWQAFLFCTYFQFANTSF